MSSSLAPLEVAAAEAEPDGGRGGVKMFSRPSVMRRRTTDNVLLTDEDAVGKGKARGESAGSQSPVTRSKKSPARLGANIGAYEPPTAQSTLSFLSFL